MGFLRVLLSRTFVFGFRTKKLKTFFFKPSFSGYGLENVNGDYGRFVPMHFRSRERNDHIVNVRSRERKCGRFVPGTKLPIVLVTLVY